MSEKKGKPSGVNRQLGQDSKPGTPDSAIPLVVIDVEWTRHPRDPRRNEVLCYGLRLESGEESVTHFFYPKGCDRRSRLTLSAMLGKLIDRAIPDVLSGVPQQIVLVGHYARGDLSACKDFAELKKKFDSANGVFVSSRGPAALDLKLDPKTGRPLDDLPRLPDSRVMRVPGAGDVCAVSVTFRDTSLLVVEDAKRSLGSIGALVGLPKLELPDGYTKDRMDLFLNRDKPAFESYLRRDLEIPARYYRRLEGLMTKIGLSFVPPTLGAAAIAKFHQVLRELRAADGSLITADRLFAIEHHKGKAFSRSRGSYYTRTRSEMALARTMIEPLFAASYHGGRTEVYETGPSRFGELVSDIDMMSAYPTGQAALRIPNYGAAFMTEDPADFGAGALGAAEVKFSHPPGFVFPVFPVKTQHGLVFPRRGIAVVTAPEIAAAVHLGVEFRIRRGIVIPWTEDLVWPFLSFVQAMIAARDSLKKEEAGPDGRIARVDTLESQIVKTMTNSLYGKTAQAVHPRNVFDSRTGTDRPLTGSSVSNAAFAAFTTGLTRAALAEMLNRLPAHRRVLSASTDGFAATATIDEIDVSGPACRVLAASRGKIAGRQDILEYKKQALQVVMARSRAAFTAVVADGSKPILAKGSIKVPQDKGDPNSYLLEVYLGRDINTRIPRQDLTPFRELWMGNADLVRVDRDPRINFEPDHKRRLTDPRMVVIAGGPHVGREPLATSSEPHETAEAMVEVRTLFEGWRHSTGRCLKDLADMADWVDYRDSTLAARAAGRRPHRTAGGSADDLKRQFLRALTRGELGVCLGGRSYGDVAAWLSAAGYLTSASALKNAARATSALVESSVAATDKTTGLLLVILDEFPAFQFGRVIVRGHVEKLMSDPRVKRLLQPAPAAEKIAPSPPIAAVLP